MQSIKNLMGVTAFVCAMIAMPSNSGALSSATGPQPWGEFSFGDVGFTAGSGVGFVPSDGGNSFFLLSPEWTFTGSGILIVQDAFFPGDQFRIFDNGVPIGITSLPITSTIGCGSDPVDCFADARSSRGKFPLAAGDHSFNIELLLSPHFAEFGRGASYFCIETGADNCGVSRIPDPTVPEPASMLMLGFGLAGAFLWVKRPQLSKVLVLTVRKRQRR